MGFQLVIAEMSSVAQSIADLQGRLHVEWMLEAI